MNIASPKSIWGHGNQFDGEEVSSLFSSGGAGVVRYRGVIKEKSPDFRSPDFRSPDLSNVNDQGFILFK